MERLGRVLAPVPAPPALPEPPVIMAGGAVVTPEYAQRIGARYAKDARQGVEIAREVLG